MPFGGTTADYINTSLMSFLGQVDYRLMDRYTLSVNARADGSNQLSYSWWYHRHWFVNLHSGADRILITITYIDIANHHHNTRSTLSKLIPFLIVARSLRRYDNFYLLR